MHRDRVANPVIMANPSARPTRSMNFAVGNFITPPTMLETMLVVPVSAGLESVSLDQEISVCRNFLDIEREGGRGRVENAHT
jgi:hypothetical protein